MVVVGGKEAKSNPVLDLGLYANLPISDPDPDLIRLLFQYVPIPTPYVLIPKALKGSGLEGRHCYDHVKPGQLRHSDSDIPSRTSPLTYFVNSAGLTSFSYITYHT